MVTLYSKASGHYCNSNSVLGSICKVICKVIHKETPASPSLVPLNRTFLPTPEELGNPTWHQKQSNIPQPSPPRGTGRWCCPLGTGCSSPSCPSLGDRRLRGCPGASPGTGEAAEPPSTVPTWSTIAMPAQQQEQQHLCPSSAGLQEFDCFLISLQECS